MADLVLNDGEVVLSTGQAMVEALSFAFPLFLPCLHRGLFHLTVLKPQSHATAVSHGLI